MRTFRSRSRKPRQLGCQRGRRSATCDAASRIFISLTDRLIARVLTRPISLGAAFTSLEKLSTAAPVTAHARHDHRPARPEFLDVSRVAFPHGVRTRIEARIDIVGPKSIGRIDGIGIDTKTGRRPADSPRRRRIGHRLRQTYSGWRGLRRCARGRQQKRARDRQRKQHGPDPNHSGHPNFLPEAHGPRFRSARQLRARGPIFKDAGIRKPR